MEQIGLFTKKPQNATIQEFFPNFYLLTKNSFATFE